MVTKKQVKKGGYPTNGKQFLLRVRTRIFWIIPSLLKRLKKTNKKRKVVKMQDNQASQAQRFVESRSATFQYAIDVFALAFILALIFTIINHVVK